MAVGALRATKPVSVPAGHGWTFVRCMPGDTAGCHTSPPPCELISSTKKGSHNACGRRQPPVAAVRTPRFSLNYLESGSVTRQLAGCHPAATVSVPLAVGWSSVHCTAVAYLMFLTMPALFSDPAISHSINGRTSFMHRVDVFCQFCTPRSKDYYGTSVGSVAAHP